MAHSTNLLLTATILLLYLMFEGDEVPEKYSGLIFGAFLGLYALSRWSGVLMGIFPITYFGIRLFKAIHLIDKSALRFQLRQSLLFAGAFLLTVSPQITLWYRLHQRFFLVAQGPTTFVNSLLPINLLEAILYSNRGLLPWSPFFVLGFVGLFRISPPRIRWPSIIFVISVILLIGYRTQWSGGGGYGTRYFIETLPILAIGYLSIWRPHFKFRPVRVLFVIVAALLLMQQFTLMHAFEHAIEPGWIDYQDYHQDAPIDFQVQIDSFLRLVRDPGLLIEPRPYVGIQRQTILTNLISGERDLRMYSITGSALLLAPIFLFAAYWVRNRYTKLWLKALSWFNMIYAVLWGLVFFFLD
jgi:hypothetical protein